MEGSHKDLPAIWNQRRRRDLCSLCARRAKEKSGPWMELSMDRFQALLIDMGVNLRGRNIGVTEHFLDNAQIGAVA
jgi:hypothetical protein